ncbi:MAG: dTDP-4-dehydrorhamnose 3,5-epimerase [Deltaproteobacteria bacterium]|nr:dTDP-4-dehydrorhamnose 3,5-epimerase [Deltaproteobacteria bacterium]MBN2674445.1 dTDP-4-dehydrorhamnose 3,5-epimerase [Deltaproteobacteria bacterium]
MNVIETSLPGVIIIEPKVFGDHRGFFMESYSRQRYADAGIPEAFVQDNISFSSKGVLRGLHFQNPGAQGKLVQVLQGEVFDVAVDIRVGSPTFGKWEGVFLSGENKKQFYVPPDFAHGFVVTSETALFAYKCTRYYSPQTEGSVRYDDPAIGIEWPNLKPVLAEKDANAPVLADIAKEKLPVYSR